MTKLTRRDMFRSLGAAALAHTPPARPNVLLLMCDQMTPRVMSVYGGPVETPNIERIARRGVVFEGATCPTPVCSPSRGSLVTGRYPHDHGIVRNVMRVDYPAVGGPDTEEGIDNTDITTERVFDEAGYSTHQYGKWHLSGEKLRYLPDQFGEHHEYAAEMKKEFAAVRARPKDEWMDWYGWALPVTRSPSYERSFQSDPLPSRRNIDFIAKAGRLDIPLERTFDYRVADQAIRRLGSVGDRPFMITASFNLPHDPNVIPSPYYEKYDPARIEFPSNFENRDPRYEKDWSRELLGNHDPRRVCELLRIYYGSVRLIDDQVGRILDALEAGGQADNTIILFTADHGDMAGAHGMFWKSTGSFYDDVATVPFIVSPAGAPHRGRSTETAAIIDICPTLLELTGQRIPTAVQGRSLAPIITGRGKQMTRQFNFCERLSGRAGRRRGVAPDSRGNFMVRGQGWKYVRHADGYEILYNLEQDPLETRNLADDPGHEGQKDLLSRELNSWRRATNCAAS